ncbi:MAG: hypothetical protein JKY18_03840, partial [Flavobacteriales bacterium]|nr:hypothetical protein [Flavobacteriales bacterium]
MILLSLLSALEGISMDTTFVRTFGGLRYEEGASIAATLDSGYVMVGSTGSFGLGNSDIYIIKTDSIGTVEWTRSYGGVNTDVGLNVKQTADSGYVITGYTNSFGAGGYDVYLIRINNIGDTLWTKTYGGTDWDFGYEVVETFDNGFA